MRWFFDADRTAKRALFAGGLGWMLDSFDINLYALVLPSLMTALSLDQTKCRIASVDDAARGGGRRDRLRRAGRSLGPRARADAERAPLFDLHRGVRLGAERACSWRCSAFCSGLGMGGEWASGAALVSETWPDEHRGKALGLMQSAWAIGFVLAAIVNWLVQDVFGLDWRAVFFVGVLPALFTLWVRRGVEEPEMWRRTRATTKPVSLRKALGGPMLGLTTALALMNACTLFGYWGFNTWVPSFLRAPASSGGLGLEQRDDERLRRRQQHRHVVWLRVVRPGQRRVGTQAQLPHVPRARGRCSCWPTRRRATSGCCSRSVRSPRSSRRASSAGLARSPPRSIPTAVRATAQGFTYNIGRVASAFAPADRRLSRAHARLSRGARDRRRGVRGRDVFLDLHSGDERAGQDCSSGHARPVPWLSCLVPDQSFVISVTMPMT